ncbi:hypothetical protein ACOSQ4_027954 [Xanthoceras sorbifolium]
MFYKLFDVNIFYETYYLSSVSIKPFEQKRKETTRMITTINALPSFVCKEVAKTIEDGLIKKEALNFYITIRAIRRGSLLHGVFEKEITASCENVKMLFPSNNSKFGRMFDRKYCQVTIKEM